MGKTKKRSGRRRTTRKLRGGANYVVVNTNEEGPFFTPKGMPLPKGKKAVLRDNLPKSNANNSTTSHEKYLKKLFSMPEVYNKMKEAAVARELIPFLLANASCTKATTSIMIPTFDLLKPLIPAIVERLEKVQQGKLIKKLGTDYTPAVTVLKSLLTETKEVDCKSIEKAIVGLESAYKLLKWKNLQDVETALKERGQTTYFDPYEKYKLAHKFLEDGDELAGAPPDILLKKYEIEMPEKFYIVDDYLKFLEKGFQFTHRAPKTKKSGNTGFGLLSAAMS